MLDLIWKYIYYSFNSYQIINITIIVLFISEIPTFFFTFLDVIKLDCLKKYRIHCYHCASKCIVLDKEKVYPKNKEILYVFKESYKPFLKIYIPLIYFSSIIFSYYDYLPYRTDLELPNVEYILLELFIISIFGDLLFNLLHRLFHTKYLYQNFHKRHHEYHYTFAAVKHYLYNFEAFCFLLPPTIPPLLFNSHIMVMWLWIIIAQFAGTLGHCGYSIPLLNYLPTFTTEYHDKHHILNNKNFGLLYVWLEKLLGTYSN